MSSRSWSTATLRTKTGCFTCRDRHRKCDEKRPSCHNCAVGNRMCSWPSPKDLVDKRHRYRPIQIGLEEKPFCEESAMEIQMLPSRRVSEPGRASLQISFTMDPILGYHFHSELEAYLFHHFITCLLPLLILSGCHPGFYNGYVHELLGLLTYSGVKSSLLACGALHLYMLSNDLQLRDLSLKYYSRALADGNRGIAEGDWERDTPSDGLVTTTTFLYIYALWGNNAQQDAPKHIAGATQMLKLRGSHSPKSTWILRPFDRVTVESVLYQSFSLWMADPFSPDFAIDVEFWLNTGSTAEGLNLGEDSSSANSPVLGAPLRLHKHILDVSQLYHQPIRLEAQRLSQLQEEMQYWENAVLTSSLSSEPARKPSNSVSEASCFHCATIVYVLATSLLLELFLRLSEGQEIDRADMVKFGNSWQVRQAMDTLRRPEVNETWTMCYLGSWPMLIIGYALEKEEDMLLMRMTLEKMYKRMGYGLVNRILKELEVVWHSRKLTKELGVP